MGTMSRAGATSRAGDYCKDGGGGLLGTKNVPPAVAKTPAYAFLTNSDLSFMPPKPSMSQSIL